MIATMFLIGAIVVIGQALFAFTFFIAGLQERENRAAILGGLQFLVMAGIAIAYVYPAITRN